MNGKPKKKLPKLTVPSAIKQATASKIAATKSSTTQSGQAQRQKAYAAKPTAVAKVKSIESDYLKRKKAVAGGGKDSMSYGQLRELSRTANDRAAGTSSKFDFNYSTTRPAPNLKGASKALVKASKKLNQAGGRKAPKR